MKINIIVNKIYDGWSPTDTRLGGSEETVVEWAKRLKNVKVFSNFHTNKLTLDGVDYLQYSDYKPADVCVNVNYPEFDTKEPTLYWTSLTKNPNTDKFQMVCALSRYAKDNTGLPYRTELLEPGYDPDKIYPEDKIPKQCFYGSSPDRGLDILLEAWPSVYRAHPDATLLLTYGGHADLQGVINLGEVDEDTMNEVYRTSDFWCHPANGGELYCITGKKAQVSGCIPVIIPTMALQETVRRGYKTDKKDYAQSLIEALSVPESIRNVIRQDVIKNANALTWDESTDKLLQLLNQVLQ